VDFPILETAKIHWNPNLQRDSVSVQQCITGQLFAINSLTEGAWRSEAEAEINH